MTMPIGPRAMPLAPPNPKSSDDERLKKTAQQLEGLFVQQLYKSMRATVPQGEGVVDGGSGEEMFTGLMDEKLAADTPSQWEHGLASAAYRQLRGAVARQSAAPDPTTPPALKLDPSR
jgi:flagellar protein FlgJ